MTMHMSAWYISNVNGDASKWVKKLSIGKSQTNEQTNTVSWRILYGNLTTYYASYLHHTAVISSARLHSTSVPGVLHVLKRGTENEM